MPAPVPDAPPVETLSTPPDPREGARPPGPALAALEAVLVSGLPSQLVLGLLLAGLGLAPFEEAGGGLSMRYVAAMLSADTILLVGLIVWRLRAGGERPRAVLLGAGRWTREAWLGLVLIPFVFGGVAALMLGLRRAWPWLHNVDANPFEALTRSPLNAAVLLVLVVVSGGLKEECQRAFVLHRFEQSLGGARAGLVLYSLVFGAGHMLQGYDVGIATMALGVVWGLVFLWRRSIVAPAVCHAGFNAAQIVQFLVPGV